MAVRENFRPRRHAIEGSTPDEGIVGWDRTVVAKPHDLAAEIVEPLGALHLIAFARGHVDQPGAVESDARAEVQPA